MRRPALSLTAFLVLALSSSCDRVVTVGTSSAGGANAGATGTVTSAGTTSGVATSTGATSGDCGGFIDVTINASVAMSPPMEHWTDACANAYPSGAASPVGYVLNAAGSKKIVVHGCELTQYGTEDLELTSDTTALGTSTMGKAVYTATGVVGVGNSGKFTMTLTHVGGPGGTIDGTYDVYTTISQVSGSFHVCQVADHVAP